MGEPWVKIFLKNAQFQTANRYPRKSQDHVYEYLMSKYKNIFDIPQIPQKVFKSKPKLKKRSISLNKSLSINKSVSTNKHSLVEDRCCQRCIQKYPDFNSNMTTINKNSSTPQKKRTKSLFFSKKKQNQIVRQRSKQLNEVKLDCSMSTRPISLCTFNKRAGFIRKPIETPIQQLISSQRRGLRV